MTHPIRAAAHLVSLPWNAFVGGFLYYTLLAVLALAGLSPSVAIVATAYLAPAVAYLVYVAGRAAASLSHGVHGNRRAARLLHAASR